MAARSLKSLFPVIEQRTGATRFVLYERQRVLLKAGMLAAGPGRGPGSGIRVTAPSAALLLITILATDTLSEAVARAQEFASAKPKEGRRCPLTGMTTFVDALAAILSAAGARKVTEVTISRNASRAAIKYRGGVSEFVGSAAIKPSLRVEATLERDGLRAIADAVRALIECRVEQEDQG
jgi:hypothetical protein